jgi:hypothetical protein
MSARIETLQMGANVGDLLPIFDKGHVAIVLDGTKFLGLHHSLRSAHLSAPPRAMIQDPMNEQHRFATRAIHVASAGPHYGRGHDADLRDVDLCAGKPRHP